MVAGDKLKHLKHLVQTEGKSARAAASVLNIHRKTAVKYLEKIGLKSRWAETRNSGQVQLTENVKKCYLEIVRGRGTCGYRWLARVAKSQKMKQLTASKIRIAQKILFPSVTRWKQSMRFERTTYHVDRVFDVCALDQNEKLNIAGVYLFAMVDARSLRPLYVLLGPVKSGMAHVFGYQVTCARYRRPKKLTLDRGTENYDIIHEHLLHNREDPAADPRTWKSLRIVRSTRNIKVERGWCDINAKICHPLRTEIRNLMESRKFSSGSDLDCLALQVAVYSKAFVRLPEFLDILCLGEVNRRGSGCAELHNRTRYEVFHGAGYSDRWDSQVAWGQLLVSWENEMKRSMAWPQKVTDNCTVWRAVAATKDDAPLRSLYKRAKRILSA
eukprot:Hpha_TRINITY_DN1983_c0_g1::TRINITY_DN1983_c0_g1_i1::g.31141::m.31141